MNIRLLAPAAACSLLWWDGSWAAPAEPTVTIEAQREQELRQAVNQFVQETIARPNSTEDSLLRWESKVCPLVSGLVREEGEWVLHRFSETARTVKAPLAGEDCQANLFVVLARNPRDFLELWWEHDHRLFSTENGVGAVKHFIETPRPVRVWYSERQTDPNTGAEIATFLGQGFGLAQSVGLGGGQRSFRVNRQPTTGSRLTLPAVRGIVSAIVVVDVERIAGLNLGQLTDYVSMVSLAEIKPDTDVGGAPSILGMFRDQESPAAQGLSVWDQALLRAVYSTRQRDRMQLSEIETAALKDIKAAGLH